MVISIRRRKTGDKYKYDGSLSINDKRKTPVKWIEVKVLFKPEKEVVIEELISDVFETAETGGVAIERPDIEPAEGWDPGPVSKPDHFSVAGYLPAEENSEGKLKLIETGINELIKKGFHCELIYSTIADEDWSETWKEFFKPVKITDRLVVKPTWRDYQAKEGEMIIEIDPGMAFGTGTHATTDMCMQLMEKHFTEGETFLDIGTGSGILMVAADLFKASKMTGTDIDELAIETAEKNLLLNKINSEKFSLVQGNLSDTINEKYDFVAANILAEIIVELLPDIEQVIKKDGYFVCSGILEEKADMIIEKMEAVGFSIIETIKKDSWAAIAGKFVK